MKCSFLKMIQCHETSYVPRKTLKKNWGDGYLYSNNMLYRNIRDEALGKDIKFTTNDFCNYKVFPLGALDDILRKKQVPYLDNVSVYKKISKKFESDISFDDVMPVKANMILHETCHCLADNMVKKLNLNQLSPQNKFIFKRLIGESFANAVESLANIFNHDKYSKKFYSMNSYLVFDQKKCSKLNKVRMLMGDKKIFQLIFISYLYSNMLYEQVSTKDFKKILNYINDEKKEAKLSNLKIIKEVFNFAFELSLNFRLKTADCYFKSVGNSKALDLIIKSNINQVFELKSFRPFLLQEISKPFDFR